MATNPVRWTLSPWGRFSKFSPTEAKTAHFWTISYPRCKDQIYLATESNPVLTSSCCTELVSAVARVMDTNPSSPSSGSGGSCVLARCQDYRCGVWRLPPAPAVSDGVQHRERHLVHWPGPAVRHHQLQDIQGHPAGHPEVWWRTPVQVSLLTSSNKHTANVAQLLHTCTKSANRNEGWSFLRRLLGSTWTRRWHCLMTWSTSTATWFWPNSTRPSQKSGACFWWRTWWTPSRWAESVWTHSWTTVSGLWSVVRCAADVQSSGQLQWEAWPPFPAHTFYWPISADICCTGTWL